MSGQPRFRPEIAAMAGYVPGEQPRDRRYIKLNTNENPYPPSPQVAAALRTADAEALRLYPDPVGGELRAAIARLHGLAVDNVLLGNGSDDILTIAVRSFVPSGGTVICLEPSYSLYPVLAQLQGASCRRLPLTADFLGFPLPGPGDGGELFLLARPNAPTGTSMPLVQVAELAARFPGMVLVDEAYADFADDDAVPLLREFRNLMVCRTLSKSYSLAGLRLGYVLADAEAVAGMMKAKDSYNVDALSQRLAVAAVADQEHLRGNVARIRATRERLAAELRRRGYAVPASQANFVFAAPPDGRAEELYRHLKARGILIRYFPGSATGCYVRITVGTDGEIDALLQAL
jgi:histidinol-phosphate aminotransferase